MSLTGKVAIITGGSSGSGEDIARLFAEKGAGVLVADINDTGGERVTAEIKATGAETVYVHADVATDAGTPRTAGMIKAATDAFGWLDVLVNNAGYTHNLGPMTNVDEATFDKGLRRQRQEPDQGCCPDAARRQGPQGRGRSSAASRPCSAAADHRSHRSRSGSLPGDAETPQEGTLEAFDRLVKAGKVRAISASNFTAD